MVGLDCALCAMLILRMRDPLAQNQHAGADCLWSAIVESGSTHIT